MQSQCNTVSVESQVEVEENQEKIIICDDCGCEIDPGDEYEQNGETLCNDCFHEKYSACDHCGDLVEWDDMIPIHDSRGNVNYYVCDYCADRHYYKCEECGDYYEGNAVVSLYNGDHVCQSCLENRGYFYCEECGEWYPDHMYGGNDRCEDCYHSGPVHGYHSFDGDIEFYDTADDAKIGKLYLGFELEMGGADSYDRDRIAEYIVDHYSDYEGLFHLEEDCSIPNYGFEMISAPMTLDFHRSEMNWQRITDYCSDRGLKGHDLGPDACGLHIHACRKFLNNFQWYCVDYLIAKNQERFEIFARRPETSYAKYRKNKSQFNQNCKTYGTKAPRDRYQAVNFNNRNTVEFRLFRSTLKYETLIASLELVDAICRWAKQITSHEILTVGVYQSFKNYLVKNSSRYATFIDRFENAI